MTHLLVRHLAGRRKQEPHGYGYHTTREAVLARRRLCSNRQPTRSPRLCCQTQTAGNVRRNLPVAESTQSLVQACTEDMITRYFFDFFANYPLHAGGNPSKTTPEKIRCCHRIAYSCTARHSDAGTDEPSSSTLNWAIANKSKGSTALKPERPPAIHSQRVASEFVAPQNLSTS